MNEFLGISIVVPVYNSAQSLPLLCQRLKAVLTDMGDRSELILVNDGSEDNSWKTIETLSMQHEWIIGINLMRNFGQHNALLCGIRTAQYELIVTMDDDLQHPPEEIPKLLAKLNEGYDVVYGAPGKMQHGLMRNLASRITKLILQGSMGVDAASHISAYRMMRTHLREAFQTYRGVYISIDVLLTWGTTRFAAIEIQHEARKYGTSNYTFIMLLRHAINMVTGFSVLPLQLASWIGFGFTLFGIGVLIYVIGRFYIEGGSVPGFPFLASIVAIFSGVQLFALGIIGEYLARMHLQVMDRPSYIVREQTGRHRQETPSHERAV